MEAPEPPENIKCPYCGALNSVEGEFCGACYKNLRVPKEVRAEAAARRILAGAAGNTAPLAQTSGAAPDAPHAGRLWGRAAIIAGLFAFYLQWLRKPNYFSFLDFINLAFHEAGHVFLGFFGRFIMMLGGTIFQLLLPALCLLQLRRKRSNIGWQLCLFWIGESLLNVSIYAGDAIKQELPLVGGGEHDWTYLLTELGLIAHTPAVAKAIFLLGSAVIFYSFYLIGLDAKNREPYELGELQLR
ncbi:MAG: zinc ribbon domain-containing protein [Elusimicrobiales bacterium]|nr:zinc ribbon domain-containing protein [Elusimicrobiales bacterium]